ncbi:hypothetical protein X769_33160 [Mesorhizobium sp. LSJC268A00]|nr:hypothetical protein X769_33160 [Mesorhizobium sp. LSJC268A00]ESZ03202.1 hypothetical protein X735_33185 [Mesorhizobium sp. L2C085B000]
MPIASFADFRIDVFLEKPRTTKSLLPVHGEKVPEGRMRGSANL